MKSSTYQTHLVIINHQQAEGNRKSGGREDREKEQETNKARYFLRPPGPYCEKGQKLQIITSKT